MELNIHDNSHVVIHVVEDNTTSNEIYDIPEEACKCECDLHVDVDEIVAKYNQCIHILEELDKKPEKKWTAEEHEAWDKSVAVYQVLHSILRIPTEPRWVD